MECPTNLPANVTSAVVQSDRLVLAESSRSPDMMLRGC
jgi:hypothetical protein